MRAFSKILILAMVLVLASCGDSTRNDQGVSFTFFGWFTDTEGETGVTSTRLPLSVSTDFSDENTILYAGLQNNLVGQFIQLDSVQNSYYIPGASITIPSTTYGVSSLIGPAAQEGGSSTLPDGFEQGNVLYAGVYIITPQVMEFIQLSREYLPEPPFTMIITSKFHGTTSSGKGITTNEVQFAVTFFSDITIGAGAPADA